MAHTNSTPNYSLPQFISTDKPGWLTDVNSGYSAIDTAMKANSDAAAAVDTKVGNLSSLTTDVTTSVVAAINSLHAVSEYSDPGGTYIVRRYGKVVYVRLSGSFDLTAGAYNNLVTLPIGYRPQEYCYNVLWDNNATSSEAMFLRGRVAASGAIQIYSPNARSNRTIQGEFVFII